MKKKHVIIGASAAALGVLTKLRALAPHDDIFCIAAQPEMPFNTCLLANYLSTGSQVKGLHTKPQRFFDEHAISLQLNTRVIEIDNRRGRIQDEHERYYDFDTLFLGIGTEPGFILSDFTPQKGMYRFHTLADTIAIDAFIKTDRPKTALVIGAGLSGLECADALTQRGLCVTIIDTEPHPLPKMVIPEAGKMLTNRLYRAGTFYYQTPRVDTILVEPISGRAVGVHLKNNTELFADMIVTAIGSHRQLCLINPFEFSFHANGGIVVDRHMHTTVKNVYCGGDAASVPTPAAEGFIESNITHMRNTTWPDAMQQGMVAAHAMAGKPIDYPGLVTVTSSSFYGIDFVATPLLRDADDNDDVVTYASDDWIHTFILRDGQLHAFSLLGNLRNIGILRKLLTTRERFDLRILDPLGGVQDPTERSIVEQ